MKETRIPRAIRKKDPHKNSKMLEMTKKRGQKKPPTQELRENLRTKVRLVP